VFPERALDDRVSMVHEGTGPRGNEVVLERRFPRRGNRASLAGNTRPLYRRCYNFLKMISLAANDADSEKVGWACTVPAISSTVRPSLAATANSFMISVAK
jgi:hypothetical protein